jgi:hypothetical protein
MEQFKALLRPIWQPVQRLLSRIGKTLRFEASAQRRELRLASLAFWRSRSPLAGRLLVVYKHKDLSDHLLYAMLAHLRRTHTGVPFLGFPRHEKPRANPALGAEKLVRGVNRAQPGTLFAYDSPLSVEEMAFLQAEGIPVASNTVGLDSFFCGGAATQAEAFAILRAYRWYFVNHAPHVPRLRVEGVNAIALPMAYEPRWFHPLSGEELRYDVLFVGDIDTPLNSSRRALLERISRHFRVTMLSYRPPGIDGVEHIGVAINPRRLNRILNRARLVLGSDRLGDLGGLNQLPEQTIFYEDEFYIRQRVYLALGAGACYLVERHPEIARQFVDGREIVLWDDEDELCDRIAYYLAREDERRAVGLAGHSRVRAGYTTEHLMSRMLRQMELLPGE